MTDDAPSQPTSDRPAPAAAEPSPSVWARIKDHKIAQWTLAYAAAAYALLDGTKIVSEALDWPHQVLRIVTVLLIAGLPLVVTLAWFHGHRALHRVSGRELTIITVLLVLAGGFLWRFARAPEVASEHLATVSPATDSIAVLPLANESGDPNQQYFSDGLSENLITALTQFPGLKVIGRTSAFQFRDSKEDAHSIGAKLGVARLLEGSVQRSGETVRVRADLIDTTDGSTQWSERYDRPFKDLFALQDDITQAVVRALRGKLLPGQYAAAQDERPPGGSLEAYNALLQGRFYMSRDDAAGFRQGVERFAKATTLDPQYALAWRELSFAWSGLATELDTTSAGQAFSKSRNAIDRALALAPDLASAHVARGFLLQRADFDWHGAENEYRRALTLAPDSGEAQFYLGQQLAVNGDVEQAIRLTRQALVSEPLQSNWLKWQAWYLLSVNRLDEAEKTVRQAIQLQPTGANYYQDLTFIEILRGNAPAALEMARLETAQPLHDTAVALALQIGHDRHAADTALQALLNRRDDSISFNIADVYALRNDPGSMFHWLDRAWSNRNNDLVTLLSDPFILRFKNDPRFAAFCRKVGLPAPGEKASAI